MFENYLKIAFRNLVRNKVFSAINIFGLSIGIATCLIILLFVHNELSYDRFNEKADRIVRVVFKGSVQGQRMKEANVMPPTAQTLKRDYPEVLEATRLRHAGSPIVRYGQKMFKEDAFVFVDSNFFQVFTLPLIRGDAKSALLEPNTLVISRAVASKYFDNEDPIGRVLDFKNAVFKITGVIDKVPANAHFHFDFFASMATLPEAKSPSWMTSGFFTYLVLPAGYDYKKLEAKLPQVVEKYMGPQLQIAMGVSLSQFRKKGNAIGLFLQPLTDIHLRSDLMPLSELEPSGDIRYVYIFGAIALFMLLIACINFMNLSTAAASKRAMEVGIRKTLGSLKLDLVRQFLIESVMLTIFALLLAIIFVYMALPLFNELAGKNLSLQFNASPWLLPGLILFGILTGVLAGTYPAFFLSSFNPIHVLKGRFISGRKSIGLRSGLVVFQFFISITLIVSTTVVYQQLAYIQNKKLGYDKEQVLVLPETWLLGNKQEVFRQQLLQDPHVISVSSSGYLPAGPTNSNNFFVYAEEQAAQVKTLKYEVDYNYIPTLGIQMAAGRNFSKDFSTDTAGMIINETSARTFGWDKNAIGHTLTTANNEGGRTTYRIIGVVKDFHFRSLHEPISPLVMILGSQSGTMIVKTKIKDIPGLLSSIQKNWIQYKAEAPLVYSFLEDRINRTYESEEKVGRLLGIFASLTIFVACLGVFGLARFTAEQRSKEIGIRKVLGSTITGIVSLLSKDFLKLVIVAFIIASPIAWLIMNTWLQDFAYRIDISWWFFALAAVLSILITIITISFQAIKAALANPVKSLRSE